MENKQANMCKTSACTVALSLSVCLSLWPPLLRPAPSASYSEVNVPGNRAEERAPNIRVSRTRHEAIYVFEVNARARTTELRPECLPVFVPLSPKWRRARVQA